MAGLRNPIPPIILNQSILPPLFKGYLARKSGQYHGMYGAPPAATAYNHAADRITAIPFLVMVSEAFDRIGVEITTGAEGQLNLGLYSDVGLYPGALLASGNIPDTSTTGTKLVTINATLDPGLYWLASVFSSGSVSTRAFSSGYVPGVLGFNGLSNEGGVGNTYRGEFAFADMPNPFPAIGINNGYGIPAIFMRRV